MSEVTERHVQAIWYDAAFRPANLFTRRGSEVRVIHPGDWNLGPGPDFLNAVLEIGWERRRVVGDVEVHLHPSDWESHRHGADERYRNVIAHVTWGCGPIPASLPPGCVSIWIGRFVLSNVGFAPSQVDLTAYPFARETGETCPCEKRFGHDPARVRDVLSEAGRHRLLMKVRRIGKRLAERCDRRQTFYEEVMSAFGYARNAIPFRRVAERVPLAALPSESSAAKAAVLTAGTFEDWDRVGMRPSNAPERRLAAAADVITLTPTMSLAEAREFAPADLRAMVKAIRGEGFVGRGRAAAIVANVVVPFAIAEGRLGDVPEWLPPEDLPRIARNVARRMLGRDHNPKRCYAENGRLVHGLIEIGREWCPHHRPECARCPAL